MAYDNKLLTVQHTWQDGDHGELIRENTQVITDEFMEEIDLLRKLQASKGQIGEYVHVCRVPRVIHNKWVAEGFDPTTANEDDYDALLERLGEMVKRLRKDGMEHFIISDKF